MGVMSSDTRDRFCYAAGTEWLNLIGTVADRLGPDPLERLRSGERLAEWLRHEENAAPDLAVTEADLAYAKRIREALWVLAGCAVEGTEPQAEAVAVANTALDAYRPPSVYVADGRLRFTSPESVKVAMAWLVRQAGATLTSETAAQLRACAEPICGAIFLDPTGRRRWCPSGRCGVKSRVRAHRERARRQLARS